jgi:hypothetical protein
MVIYPAAKESEQEGVLPDPKLMADMSVPRVRYPEEPEMEIL